MICYIKCKMRPAGFSGEVTFEITTSEGTSHLGLASRRYLLTERGKPLSDELRGESVGFVAARLLEEHEDETLVSIPDGEVVSVNSSQLIRPEITTNVPVGS